MSYEDDYEDQRFDAMAEYLYREWYGIPQPEPVGTRDEVRRARVVRELAWRQAQEQTTKFLDWARRRELEVAANADWKYLPADKVEFDDFMRRVTLEGQQFASVHEISAFESMRAPASEMNARVNHVHDSMVYELKAHIYGVKHTPINTGHTERVPFTHKWTTFASWWDAFKYALTRGKSFFKIKYVEHEQTVFHDVSLNVQAEPFSSFPELPYKAPKEWGPRIDLMLPGRVMFTSREVTP